MKTIMVKLHDYQKVIWGAVWIVVMSLLLFHTVANPFHELALIQRAQIAPGELVDSYQDEQEDFRGHVYFFDVGVYRYRVPSRGEYKTTIRVPTGQLKELQDIEYLPDNPAVSRVKGYGCQNVWEVIWRYIGAGGLLLMFLLPIGINLIREGIWGPRKRNSYE